LAAEAAGAAGKGDLNQFWKCVTNESNGMGNGYGRYETLYDEPGFNAFVPDRGICM